MTPDQERIDKVLDALSHARTALDDPSGLPEEDFRSWNEGEHNEYVIDRIDDAMRLLGAFVDEPKFGLMVCRDGASMTRLFDPEEEAIDAVGAALIAKQELPEAVITIVVGRVGP